MTEFQNILKESREQAGYPSSRAFFNRNGGAPFFGCTYRHYLNIESGKVAPGPQIMEKIAIGLGLGARPQSARKLMMAYLRSVRLSEELISLIANTLAPTPEEMQKRHSALVDSMARTEEERLYNLSREQSEYMTKKAVNYWTFAILSHDKSTWNAEKLSTVTEIPKKDHEKALGELVKLKLIEKTKDGFACPHVGKVFQHPDKKIFTTGLEALRKYRSEMTEKKGETMLRYFYFSRGFESELKQYFQFLIKSVQGADVVSNIDPGPGSVFYEVETTVKKVLSLEAEKD